MKTALPAKLRPIFKCHGGKFYQWQSIVDHFPTDHATRRYFEGCGGAASVLLNKPRSAEETYNDADPKIVAIVAALASPDSARFIEKIQSTSYTEEVFQTAKKANEVNVEDVAYTELIVRRMSRGGLRKAFGWSERLRGGRPGDLNAWETFKRQLPLIAERLQGVQVHCMKVVDLFRRFDSADTLWYLDPPYLQKTRVSKDVYTCEMTEPEHIELASALHNAKGKVLLSGYQSYLYAKLYTGWNLDCRVIANHSSQSKVKQKRVECLWMNY